MRYLFVILVGLAACDSSAEKPDAAPTPVVRVEPKDDSPPSDAPPEVRLLHEYMAPLGDGETLLALINSSEGEIRCQLFWRKSPRAVATFMGLATGRRAWRDPETEDLVERPFYDGLQFFRTVPNFVIHSGDRTNTGRVGPGFSFEDEILPELRFDRPGVLAYSNTGPNSNGSQFFVTLAAAPHLDGRHTIFGQCESLDIVRKIANAPQTPSGAPANPATITHISFERQ
ncbi:MAG: peptidylprolyl isomerase [bacterium]